MLTPVSFVCVSEIDFCRCFCVQDLCIQWRWSGMWYFIVEMGCDKNIWCSKITGCVLNCIFCDHGFVVMCYYKYLRCWVRSANVAVPRIDGGGVVVHGNVQTKWRQSKQVLTQIVDVWGKYEVVPCYNRSGAAVFPLGLTASGKYLSRPRPIPSGWLTTQVSGDRA